jgi:hypothetical protein
VGYGAKLIGRDGVIAVLIEERWREEGRLLGLLDKLFGKLVSHCKREAQVWFVRPEKINLAVCCGG